MGLYGANKWKSSSGEKKHERKARFFGRRGREKCFKLTRMARNKQTCDLLCAFAWRLCKKYKNENEKCGSILFYSNMQFFTRLYSSHMPSSQSLCVLAFVCVIEWRFAKKEAARLGKNDYYWKNMKMTVVGKGIMINIYKKVLILSNTRRTRAAVLFCIQRVPFLFCHCFFSLFKSFTYTLFFS